MNPNLGPERTTAGTKFLQSHPSFLLLAAAFLAAMATGQYMLGLIFFTQDMFQANARQVGFFAGLFSLTYAAACMAIQFHLHRIQPGRLVIAAGLLTTAIFAGTLLAGKLAHVYWLMGLVGIVLSCFWAPLSAWLFQGMEGAVLNRRLASFNLAWCLGTIISPLICGALSEISVRLPLLLATTLMLLAAGLLIMRLRRERTERRSPSAAPAAAVSVAAAESSSTPYRFPAWVGLLAIYFCVGVASYIFPPVARTQLRFTESLIGLLIFFRALSQSAGFYLVGRTHFWHFRGWPMLGGVALGALAMIGLAFTRAPVAIAILLAGLGIATASAYASSVFHGMSGSSRRGARMAIHEGLANLGVVAGSMIGGAVCQAWTINHAYWLCAGVSLAALALQGALCNRIRRRAGAAARIL